jgi:16S rRNA (guanine527-N7)-methyltransferase
MSVGEGLDLIGLELPDAAVGLLGRFADLLLARAVPLGMIGRDDAGRIVPRHVIDSLRPTRLIGARGGLDVVDVGSGAGLPGIPLAIALPEARFVLAEPRAKRAAFLELAVEQLGLANVRVRPSRAETLQGGRFTSATARAFATLDSTWSVVNPLLGPGGILVAFAGARERPPADLPGAEGIEVVRDPLDPAESPSSRAHLLATDGSLVIITAK